MKKLVLFSTFLTAAALLLSSCSKELNSPDPGLNSGDMVDVNLSVAAKDIKPVATYATNAENMISAGYQLRYTTEVFLREGEGTTGTPYTYDKLVKRIVEYTGSIDKKTTTFRIPSGTYAFVTWVDYVKLENGDVVESFYDQASLLDIQKTYGLQITSDDMQDFEVRDAFKGSAVKEISNSDSDHSVSYTVYHAVAKINVIAQDVFHLYSDYNGQDGYTPDASKLANQIESLTLSYTAKSEEQGSIDLWWKNNATGTQYYPNVRGDQAVEYVSTFNGTFDYSAASATYLTDFVIVEGVNDVQKTINNVKIDVKFKGGNTNSLVSPVDNVPVRTRYVTNLVGDILTKRVLATVTLNETWQSAENTIDVNSTTTEPIETGVGFASTTPAAYNAAAFQVAVVNATDATAAVAKITPVGGAMDIIEEFTAEQITTYAAAANKAFIIKATLKTNATAYYRQASFKVKYADNNGEYTQVVYQAPASSNRNAVTGATQFSDVNGKSGALTSSANRSSATLAQMYADVAQQFTVTDLYGEKVGNYHYTYVDVIAPTKRNARSLKLTLTNSGLMGGVSVGYKDANGEWVADGHGLVTTGAYVQTPGDQQALLTAWADNGGTDAVYVKWTVRVQTNFNEVSTKEICALFAFQDYEWLSPNKAQSGITVNANTGAISQANLTNTLADGSTHPFATVGYLSNPATFAGSENPYQFGLKFNPRVFEMVSKTNTSKVNTEYDQTGAYLPKEGDTYEVIVNTNRVVSLDCLSTTQTSYITDLAFETVTAPVDVTKVGQYKLTYKLGAITTATESRGAHFYFKPAESVQGGAAGKFDENPATALLDDVVYQQGYHHVASQYKVDDTKFYGFVNTSDRAVTSDANYFVSATPAPAAGVTNNSWIVRTNRFATANALKAALTLSNDAMVTIVNVTKITDVAPYADGGYDGLNLTGDSFYRVYFSLTENTAAAARNSYIRCDVAAAEDGSAPAQNLNVRIYQAGTPALD